MLRKRKFLENSFSIFKKEMKQTIYNKIPKQINKISILFLCDKLHSCNKSSSCICNRRTIYKHSIQVHCVGSSCSISKASKAIESGQRGSRKNRRKKKKTNTKLVVAVVVVIIVLQNIKKNGRKQS